jgi:Holliday junction resolvase RusA-like endonuclease
MIDIARAPAFADTAIRFTIIGEPASKSNQRKIVTIANRPSVIKSAKARDFERSALYQIPVWARQRLEGPVRMSCKIYYASERPDLDESLILDILQDRWGRTKPNNPIIPSKRYLVQPGVYRNDRQVRERHVYHAIDKQNPRVEIIIEPLLAQQEALL